ncbi:MAG: SMC-Scp complex subunit ScpB [Asgard group archaeon]|nr:SMC-Scp complex subunit ScpB [Asgard group archaeon]
MEETFSLSEEEIQMQKIKKQQILEAALYLAGRPVQHLELSQVTGIDTAEIGTLIKDLQERYRQSFSCFEIIELPGRKFVFQVRADIGENVKEITLQPLLTLAELRTLAMVAYQQPVLQSTVVKVRGQQSYMHIKNLIRNGFVKSRQAKQTLELRTTPMFSDYFGLSHDQGVLKRQLGWRTKRIIKEKRVEERDSRSIDEFMSQIGLDESGVIEKSDDTESEISIDKETAREAFTTMLDDLDGPDPWENDEEEELKEFDEKEEKNED